MRDAIMEITGKGFGCVGVTNQDGMLIGIVTDGDLRRKIDHDLFSLVVDEVMTRAPKTIKPDMLVAKALDIANASAITALMVVENERPVGIIHIHDLLRIGAA
jgi:arabinose-5-phosphate isomerase